jgi:hypothetical protein
MKLPAFLTKKSAPQSPPEESMEAVLAKLTTLLPAATATPAPTPRCLLLDVSMSMYGECEPGTAKIKALRQLAAKLPTVPTYSFSSDVRRIKASAIPDPSGSTNMARAFDRIRRDGYSSPVLITDGLPDDEAAALDSARGLSLEIFYVGPAPKPAFLDQLAAVAGGRARDADLSRSGSQQLEIQIRGLLS